VTKYEAFHELLDMSLQLAVMEDELGDIPEIHFENIRKYIAVLMNELQKRNATETSSRGKGWGYVAIILRTLLYIALGIFLGLADVWALGDWQYWAILLVVLLIDLNSARNK